MDQTCWRTDSRNSDGSVRRGMVWPLRPGLFRRLLADSSRRLVMRWPRRGHNPDHHNRDARPDHGDHCIYHELGRYSTRTVGQGKWQVPATSPAACAAGERTVIYVAISFLATPSNGKRVRYVISWLHPISQPACQALARLPHVSL